MTRDLGRILGGWAGGALACLLLAIAAPAASQQAAPAATTVAAPRTYSECVRGYVGRVDPSTYCRRLFPATAPVAATPATTVPAATAPTTPTPYERCLAASGRSAEARRLCAQRYPGGAPTSTPAPIDITPQINQWLDSLSTRPRPPARPPADPLAVVPEIQATCAQWAGNTARWLRCTAEAWRRTGLRGQPPLVLQTPPSPPPVIDKPPVVQEPTDQTPVRPPPVEPEPPIVKPPVPEPPILVQPDPPADVVPPPAAPQPPTPGPKPPALVEPPAPPQPVPPPTPVWAWALAILVALLAAGAGGFGLSRWLAGRGPRAPGMSKPVAAAACAPPQIALVADPGVVTLTPDGPPRAGMAVSMRVVRADDADAVRLDYPTLETAP